MIQRETFGFSVICDGGKCQEFLDVDSVDHIWQDVLDAMKEEGWVSRKDRGGDWEHFCPDHK